MERQHQLHPQPLTEREALDESWELGDNCLACSQLELGGQALLERQHVKLFEAPDLALRELLVPNVDERRTAPQAECAVEHAKLAVDLLRAGSHEQSLEAGRIDGVVADSEDIAAARRLDQVRAERSPKARDQVLQRGPSRGRRSVGPEVVDQLVGRTDLACVQQKRGEERPKQLAAERQRTPVLDDLERSEDAEL